jgi:hypothetical protein
LTPAGKATRKHSKLRRAVLKINISGKRDLRYFYVKPQRLIFRSFIKK